MATKPSTATRTAYLKRDAQLRSRATTELGFEPSDAEYVDWLIDACRPSLKSSSWRQYRAAAIAGLGNRVTVAPETGDVRRRLVERLQETPHVSGPRPERTSTLKAKRVTSDDFERLLAGIRTSASPSGALIADGLLATCLTGVRPIEWWGIELHPHPQSETGLALVVTCAKHDAVRAHSPIRTLIFDRLPAEVLDALDRWLTHIGELPDFAAFRSEFDRLSRALRRIVERLLPRRRRRPSFYTMRHMAASRFKARWIDGAETTAERLEGAAVVAALLGHASDRTASRHYARAGRGAFAVDLPVPRASPAEMRRVRRRFADDLDRLRNLTTIDDDAYRPDFD